MRQSFNSRKTGWLALLARDRNGGTAITFGLAVIPLLFSAGLAIDSARGYRTKAQLSAALDAAALTTAKALRLQGLNDAELKVIAKKYFDANIVAQGSSSAAFSELTMVADHKTSTVTLSAKAMLPTTIGRLMDVDSLDLPGQSTAVYDARDVELAMMLDVSGSMSGSKIEALRASAKDLVKIILTANEGGAKHKIAIAPYSTAVNAGPYAISAKGAAGTNTCVTERSGIFAFTDKSPGDGVLGKKASWCPEASITPLLDDKTMLNNSIDDMKAAGSTAGHLGTGWAWYLISPEWANFWPSESKPKPYDDVTIAKTAILMTDGMFNKEYEAGNGKSAEQAVKLCTNMKAKGINVYTIGFQAPADALAILSACASSPSNFFDAQDAAQLNATFKDIANRLTSLRISG